MIEASTSALLLIVPAPRPYASPAAKKISVMIRIRLSMNGESPITRPVSGSCSGAPGITVSNTMTAITASVAHSA